MYLSRALDEFHRSANAPDLWVPVDAFHRDSLLEGSQKTLTAQNRRIQFLRSAIVFAAISAEALANEVLADLLSAADADALDSLGVPEKLIIGTRLAAGKDVLDRGRYPIGALITLAKTRNRLVHPKPNGGLAAWSQDVEAEDGKAVGPRAAENAILAVADVAVLCNPLRPHPSLHDGLAKTVAKNRDLVIQHRRSTGPFLREVPPEGTPGSATLSDQMQARWVARLRERRQAEGQPHADHASDEQSSSE